MTMDEFERYLLELPGALEREMEFSTKATAAMIGSTITSHIVADDLPLTALSSEYLLQKRLQGLPTQHLWATGEYLTNFERQPIQFGFEVGTNRDAPGFPSGNHESLPDWLEDHFPVWTLSLDELEPYFEMNFGEAAQAALEGRAGNYRDIHP